MNLITYHYKIKDLNYRNIGSIKQDQDYKTKIHHRLGI